MLLIDADTLCYVAAIMAEGLDESEARFNVDKYLEDLLIDCNDFEYICYLTGESNFRYKVYPEYKANRKDVPKPLYLPVARHSITRSGIKVKEHEAPLFNRAIDPSLHMPG